MVAIIGRDTKQPDEHLDYDIDFGDWFVGRTDSPASFAVVVPTGLTLDSSGLSGNKVRLVLSGGTDGQQYKVTVLMTTTDLITKEADFVLKIKAV